MLDKLDRLCLQVVTCGESFLVRQSYGAEVNSEYISPACFLNRNFCQAVVKIGKVPVNKEVQSKEVATNGLFHQNARLYRFLRASRQHCNFVKTYPVSCAGSDCYLEKEHLLCWKGKIFPWKRKAIKNWEYGTFSEKKWNYWDNFSDKLRNWIMKVQFGKL